MTNNNVIDVAIPKNQLRVPVIALHELLSLIDFYLDPFSLEPSLAWYRFREGLLRSLREAATRPCGGAVAIPLIGEFRLSRRVFQSASGMRAKSESPLKVVFEGWKQVSKTSEMPVCDLSVDRSELERELATQSTFWRRMPAQTQEHSSQALHSAEAVILALRYVAWYRRQAIDLPGLGILSCDFEERRLENLSQNPRAKLGVVSFSFQFSPEFRYALEEELLFQQPSLS